SRSEDRRQAHVDHGALLLVAVEAAYDWHLDGDPTDEPGAEVDEEPRRDVEDVAAGVRVARAPREVHLGVPIVELEDGVEHGGELSLVSGIRERDAPVAIAEVVRAGPAVLK